MGKVVQLRVPRKKLDRDDVILVPRETNTEASRDVLANPQNFSDSVLLTACIWLRDNGDWMDQERARHLLKGLDREQRPRAAQSKRIFFEDHKFGLACFALFLIVVGISIVDHAWGQILATGVTR